MRLELQILLPLMIVFLLAQAALGALAVIFPESPEVLALHFGVSLLSFVTLLLPTLFIFDENGWDTLRDRMAPDGFRWLTWGLLVFTYVVVYLGAYVRHTGDELGCLDWPLCNGKVLPTTHAETIVFIHRVGAGLLTIGVVWLFVWATRLRAARPDLYWGSLAALIFVLAQALDGAFVVYSRLDIFSTLSHSAFVALLFGALSYMSLHVVRRPKAVRATKATQRIVSGQRRRRGAVAGART
jgi:cytochrome c oxidase assembly protein subunit 15